MNQTLQVLDQVAPNIAAALRGPFSDIAGKYVITALDINDENSNANEIIIELAKDTANLKKLKTLDKNFNLEIKALGVNLPALSKPDSNAELDQEKISTRAQLFISGFFLTIYFMLLASILFIEASDSLNMSSGENSMQGELQILFGVLTAGVGQILSFWFGGVSAKRPANNK